MQSLRAATSVQGLCFPELDPEKYKSKYVTKVLQREVVPTSRTSHSNDVLDLLSMSSAIDWRSEERADCQTCRP